MTRAALITSGGQGTRMGGPLPKQYLALKGMPILSRTLKIFARHPQVDRIVITVPEGNERFCRERIVAPLKVNKTVDVVAGGPDRQASVYNGLLWVADTDLVAIHDGVRPLVSARIITQALSAAESIGAAVACVPIRETVKRQTDSSLQTIPREDLWLAPHTPGFPDFPDMRIPRACPCRRLSRNRRRVSRGTSGLPCGDRPGFR